jgi:hypothetical protein
MGLPLFFSIAAPISGAGGACLGRQEAVAIETGGARAVNPVSSP